jgi:Uma2 family endonuclease
MAMFIADSLVVQQLIAEREASGADRYDEVWEGVYVMNPLPNNQHQEIVTRLSSVLTELLTAQSLGNVFAGVNVSDRVGGWEHNFRAPDVAVYLRENSAVDCGTHWCGGPDIAFEIVSPGDRSREKLPFYAQVGTREVYVLDRAPWSLEHCVLEDERLVLAGQSSCEAGESLSSRALPITLQLVTGEPRPRVEIASTADGRRWSA